MLKLSSSSLPLVLLGALFLFSGFSGPQSPDLNSSAFRHSWKELRSETHVQLNDLYLGDGQRALKLRLMPFRPDTYTYSALTSPTITSTPVTSIDEDQLYDYMVTTNDGDGDAVVVTATTLPAWVTAISSIEGEVTTFAGTGSSGSNDGNGAIASFGTPQAITVDDSGNFYVADGTFRLIRKISPNGEVSTIAGTGSLGFVNANGTNASFSDIRGIGVDPSGNIYASDGGANNVIRKITLSGDVTTFVGKGIGTAEDLTEEKHFNSPAGLRVDDLGNVYVADAANHQIKKITPNAVVSVVAGRGMGDEDGLGKAAKFNFPQDIEFDSFGNLFVADYFNSKIRKISPDGTVSTFATLDALPIRLTIDANDVLFVTMSDNTIVNVAADGTVTDFAGTGDSGLVNETRTNASFRSPAGVVLDANGDLFVADQGSHVIRKIANSTFFKLVGDPLGQVGIHDVTIHGDDGNGGVVDQVFTITVNPVTTLQVDTYTPVDDATNVAKEEDMALTFNRNIRFGTGEIKIVDLDDGSSTVIIDVSAPLDQLSISNTILTINPNSDLEEDANYAILIDAMAIEDLVGNQFTGIIDNTTFNFKTENQGSPVFTSGTMVSYDENRGDTPYTALATDASAIIYSLGTGNDEALFNIDGTTGDVNFIVEPDFQNPVDEGMDNVYVLDVKSSDGTNVTTIRVFITIQPDPNNTAPVITSANAASFEDMANSIVYIGTAIDAQGDPLTFSLGNSNDEALFDIDASSGVITFKVAPDFNNPADADTDNDYLIELLVSDGIVNSTLMLTITVLPNQPPVFTSASTVQVLEHTPGPAYTATATDALPFTFSLGNSNDESLFTIDPGSGELYFLDPADFDNPNDADMNNTYIVEIKANDGSQEGSLTLTISVITDPGNGAPVFTSTPNTASSDKDNSYSYKIRVKDPDFDNVTITAPTLPTWLTLSGVRPEGKVTTLAGTGIEGSDDGLLATATFGRINGVTLDASGNIYVIEHSNVGGGSNARIRKIATDGTVSTLAGSATSGNVDGVGINASFHTPIAIEADAAGNLYVVDEGNHNVRKITPAGEVTTLAGSTIGLADGQGATAKFNRPHDLVIDASGNLFVVDQGNDRIRKITPEGLVTTFAGEGGQGHTDGPGSVAQFNFPTGIALDNAGNLLVTELITSGTGKLRKIRSDGTVVTVADLDYRMSDVRLDRKDNIYLLSEDGQIFQLKTDGTHLGLAGAFGGGFADGSGDEAMLLGPENMIFDGSGNLLVADAYNLRLRKVEIQSCATLTGNPSGKGGLHPVSLKADDGTTGITFQDFNIAVSSSNESILIESDPKDDEINVRLTSSLIFTFDKDIVSSFGNLQVIDLDDGSSTVNLGFTPLNGQMTISGSQLTVDLTNNLEPFTNYAIQISASSIKDINGKNFAGILDNTTLNFRTADLTGPTFTSPASVAFEEGGTGPAYTAVAIDNTPITYSLGTGNDENLFTIDSNTGVVNFKTSPDFANPGDANTDNNYVLNLKASDGINESTLKVTVIVQPATGNRIPIFTSAPIINILEDDDYLYEITFADLDNDLLTVTGTTLPTWLTLNTTTNELTGDPTGQIGAHGVTLTLDDGNGGVATQVFTINVISNANPLILSSQPADDADPVQVASDLVITFSKDIVFGTGNIQIIDLNDGSGTITIDVTSPGSMASINGAILTLSPTLDLEDNTNYSVQIDLTAIDDIIGNDFAGIGDNTTLNFTTGDNDAPIFTSLAGADFDENSTGTVYTAVATDARAISYTLGSGNDEAFFEIDQTTGILTFKNSPDFETPLDGDTDNVYVLEIKASDGLNESTITVNITVKDVSDNAAPVFTSTPPPSVDEDQTYSYTITATDVENHTITYVATTLPTWLTLNTTGPVVLSGDPAGHVGIHNVVLKADDGNGGTTEQSFTITVNAITDLLLVSHSPLDDATDVAKNTDITLTFNRDIAFGTGSIQIIDLDDGSGTVTIDVASPGTEATIYGAMLTLNPTTDLEESTNFAVLIPGTAIKDVLVDVFAGILDNTTFNFVTGDESAPVFTSGTTANFDENDASTVYTAIATDDSPITYSLGLSNDEALFDIDANTGVVTFRVSPDFENPLDADTNNTYVIIVKASDGNAESSITVLITVDDVFDDVINDPPVFDSDPVIEIDADGNYIYNVLVSDPNGDEVTITGTLLPDWVSTETGSFAKVSTFAGTGSNSSQNGDLASATFGGPRRLLVDSDGNVYVSELASHSIRKISSDGTVSTFAGSGIGHADGPSASAKFKVPWGLAIDPSGNLYVADRGNNRIRKVSSTGSVSTIAGGDIAGFLDGDGIAAAFDKPTALVLDSEGNLVVADLGNGRIRKIDLVSSGRVSTFAGNADTGDDDGNGSAASFFSPTSIFMDGAGDFYISDSGNKNLRKITPQGQVTTIATFDDKFLDLVVDDNGNVFFADSENHKIAKMSVDGKITRYAGTGTEGFADGSGVTSLFSNPSGLALDNDGNILVADAGNNRIRKLVPDGLVLKGQPVGKQGTHQVTLTADDGKGGVTTQTFTIKVNSVTDPRLLHTFPKDDAINLKLSTNVILDFSETVITDFNYPMELVDLDDGSSTVTITIDLADKILGTSLTANRIVINPINNLEPNTNYALRIPAEALKDLDGEPFAGILDDVTLNFRTGDGSMLELVSSDPEDDERDISINQNIHLTFNQPFAFGEGEIKLVDWTDGSSTIIIDAENPGTQASIDGQILTIDPDIDLDKDANYYLLIEGGALTDLEGNPFNGIDEISTLNFATDARKSLLLLASNPQNGQFDFRTNGIMSFTFSQDIVIGTGRFEWIDLTDGTGTGSVDVTAAFNTGIISVYDELMVYRPQVALESNTKYAIKIDATAVDDKAGESYAGILNTSSLIFTTQDTEPPLFASGTAETFPENGKDLAYHARATDVNGITYAFSGGVDDDKFTIDAISGEVRFKLVPDFENPHDANSDNIYLIKIEARDFLSSSIREVSITVIDQFERLFRDPVFTSTPVTAIDEDQLYQYEITTQDPDGDLVFVEGLNLPDWLSVEIGSKRTISTLAGAGYQGSLAGVGASAVYNGPSAITTDASGNTFMADANNIIWKITSAGVSSILAGSGSSGFADGTGSAASFDQITGLVADVNGDIFVADRGNNRIRKVTVTGVVTTFAGSATAGSADGIGGNATFNLPTGIAIDDAQNLYVSDQGSHLIRKISSQSVVTTLAGSGTAGFSEGLGAGARFNTPGGLGADIDGNVYVSDEGNARIRKISPSGVVTTFAGTGAAGFSDGLPTVAQFNTPGGIDIDSKGNVFIADLGNHRIRKITLAGVVSTIAGNTEGFNNADGIAALFSQPSDLSLDLNGNLMVADKGNHRVRLINSPVIKLTGDPRGKSGNHAITLMASDNLGGRSTQTFTIAVREVESPLLVAAARISNTVIRLTFSEVINTNEGHPEDFSVIDCRGNIYQVSAQSDDQERDDSILLTLADYSEANGELVVTYENNHNEISDLSGNFYETDMVGITLNPAAFGLAGARFGGNARAFDLLQLRNTHGIEFGQDIEFSADGNKMFLLSDDSDTDYEFDTKIYEFNLRIPFVVSTLEYAGDNEALALGDIHHSETKLINDPVTGNVTGTIEPDWAQELTFSRDGMKMFIGGALSISEWNLNAPFDVSTAQLLRFSELTDEEYLFNTEETFDGFQWGKGLLDELKFSKDGRSLFVAKFWQIRINEEKNERRNKTEIVMYELTRAFDVTSIEPVTNPLNRREWTDISSFDLSSDGLRLVYITSDQSEQSIGRIDMKSPYDFSNISENGLLHLSSDDAYHNNSEKRDPNERYFNLQLNKEGTSIILNSRLFFTVETSRNQENFLVVIDMGDKTPPRILEAIKDNDTQITLTMSEEVFSNGGNPSDFIVKDQEGNAIAVSAQRMSTDKDDQIVLTMSDLSRAKGKVTITYANNNEEIVDFNCNILATDNDGVELADDVRPTPSITSAASVSVNGAFDITITFDEIVQGFELGDLLVDNGTASNFEGENKVYTATITPKSNGEVTINILANKAEDEAGNKNVAAVQFSILYDLAGPSVTITSVEDLVNGPFEITITLDEDANGFDITDIIVGNGSASNFSGSGSIFTATITPSADGNVTVDINAGAMQDGFGNDNSAAEQFVINSDLTAPVIKNISRVTPTDRSINSSSIIFKVTFNEPVVNVGVTDFEIITGLGVTGTINSMNRISDTEYDIVVNAITGNGLLRIRSSSATSITDIAGNALSNQIESEEAYSFDVLSPSLTIGSAESGITGVDPIPVEICFDKEVTGFSIADITVSNGVAISLTQKLNHAYEFKLNTNGAGNGELNDPRGVAVDAVGNVFIVDRGNSRIQKFDASGAYLAEVGGSGNGNGLFVNPASIGIGPLGNVYVVDRNNHRVQVFDNALNYLFQFGSNGNGNGEFQNARVITVDEAGNVYVGDWDRKDIQVFDAQGKYKSTMASAGSGNGQLQRPVGLAVAKNGNLYVLDRVRSDVQVFNSSGVFQSKFGSVGSADGEFTTPSGLAVTSSGLILVSDFGQDRMQYFDATGIYLGSIGTAGTGDGQFSNLEGFSISDDLALYTIENSVGNNRLQKFILQHCFTTAIVPAASGTVTVDVVGNVVQDEFGNGNLGATQFSIDFNNTPTDIVLSTMSILENNAIGDDIGVFSTVDVDATDTHTYAFASGTGDVDNSSFTIDGNILKTAEEFDRETKASYNIRISSIDNHGNVFEKQFTITIENVAEADMRITGDLQIPATPLGLTANFSVVIHNDGDASLVISNITYPNGYGGPTSGITIAPSSNQVVVFTFSPILAQVYSGDITVISNGGTGILTVSADGSIITGIDSSQLTASSVSTYPNPAKDVLTIDLSELQGRPVDIQINDMNGIGRFKQLRYTGKTLLIDIGDYSSGLYIVLISDDHEMVQKKVVINK
jgi:sugar lactone lactonase YvrE